MKPTRLFFAGAIAALLIIAACQRNSQKDILPNNTQTATVTTGSTGPTGTIGNRDSDTPLTPGACNPYAYTITLESHAQVGSNWEWVWSVQNPTPGNGRNNGTVQNLSHWGMQFGTCFAWAAVVSGSYSADGITWTDFTPSYETDPSQSCLTTPVLKFDYGTEGSAKSYYKLVLNVNYDVAGAQGYYKSGTNTGCCTFDFSGVGCAHQEEDVVK